MNECKPQATGYHNDGYAYFPDTPALHGPEYVLWAGAYTRPLFATLVSLWLMG